MGITQHWSKEDGRRDGAPLRRRRPCPHYHTCCSATPTPPTRPATVDAAHAGGLRGHARSVAALLDCGGRVDCGWRAGGRPSWRRWPHCAPHCAPRWTPPSIARMLIDATPTRVQSRSHWHERAALRAAERTRRRSAARRRRRVHAPRSTAHPRDRDPAGRRAAPRATFVAPPVVRELLWLPAARGCGWVT